LKKINSYNLTANCQLPTKNAVGSGQLAIGQKLIQLSAFAALWLFNIDSFSQKDSTRFINPVVINTEVDTLHKISVLTSSVPHFVLDEIVLQKLGVVDVGSALRFIPGAQLKDYGGIGGIKTVSFRSLGANHTGVVFDEIKIPNVQSGAINLSPFEIFGVSQISFSSGQIEAFNVPASAYLNANSISIKSKLNEKPDQFNLQLYSSLTYISTFEEGFLLRIPISKKLFFGLQGFTKFGDGDYKYEVEHSGSASELRRENSKLFSYKLRAVTGIDLKNSKTIFSATYYNNEQELPGAMILYNPSNDQKMWNEDWRFSVTHDQKIQDWKLNLNAFYQSTWMRYYDPDFLNLQGYVDNAYLQQNGGGGFMLKRSVFKNRAFVFGGSDLIYSDLKSGSDFNPNRLENNSVLGAQLLIRNMRIESNVTLQAVNDAMEMSDSISENNFLEASPFLSVSWKPFKNQPLRFRAFYKRAFTLPTFNDLYYNLIGNTNLKPEKAHQLDAGISYSGLTKKIYYEFSADAFYNLIEDKIIAIPTKDLFNWSMQNIGRLNVYGYDLSLLVNYSKGDWKMTANGSYSYNLSLDVTNPESSTYQKQIPYTPFHSGTAGLAFGHKKMSLNVNSLFTGFRYSLNENVWANYMEPFADLSISLAQEFSIKSKYKIQISASALNVLNKNYQVIRSFPMPGRYYQFTLNLHYN
jgi:vitamin B12 transporter